MFVKLENMIDAFSSDAHGDGTQPSSSQPWQLGEHTKSCAAEHRGGRAVRRLRLRRSGGMGDRLGAVFLDARKRRDAIPALGVD